MLLMTSTEIIATKKGQRWIFLQLSFNEKSRWIDAAAYCNRGFCNGCITKRCLHNWTKVSYNYGLIPVKKDQSYQWFNIICHVWTILIFWSSNSVSWRTPLSSSTDCSVAVSADGNLFIGFKSGVSSKFVAVGYVLFVFPVFGGDRFIQGGPQSTQSSNRCFLAYIQSWG